MSELIGMIVGTEDVAGLGKFYKSLFGWSMTPRKSGMVETEISAGGRNIGGMVKRDADEQTEWVPVVRVDDMSKTMKAAKKLGARIIAAPRFLRGEGFFAVIADPTGGHVGLFQAWNGDEEPAKKTKKKR